MRTMTDEERATTTARVVFLMAGLTDDGLDRLRTDAEFYAVTHARDLTSGTLAAEQAARHGLLADADAVLSKARRERTHGTSCDCGACVAPDLHDSASDAAAVLGATVTSAPAFVSSETEDIRKAMHRGKPPPFVMSEEAAQANRWTDGARPPMMRERGGFTQRELDAIVRERATVKP